MRIILAVMEYSYGDEGRCKSYEYNHFYLTLLNMGYDVTLFDYVKETEKSNKQTMNRQLVSLVHNERPDLVFFSLFEDQFEPSAIEQINSV